jgi:hypothetical protein
MKRIFNVALLIGWLGLSMFFAAGDIYLLVKLVIKAI